MKKIVLVTEFTDCIGKQTALRLAQLGFKVIVHGRNREKSAFLNADFLRTKEDELNRFE